jgi:hypothetical protein
VTLDAADDEPPARGPCSPRVPYARRGNDAYD